MQFFLKRKITSFFSDKFHAFFGRKTTIIVVGNPSLAFCLKQNLKLFFGQKTMVKLFWKIWATKVSWFWPGHFSRRFFDANKLGRWLFQKSTHAFWKTWPSKIQGRVGLGFYKNCAVLIKVFRKMRWHLLALFAVFSLTDGLVKDLENSFKLLRIWPKTFEELQVIRALYNSSSEFEVSFGSPDFFRFFTQQLFSLIFGKRQRPSERSWMSCSDRNP